MQLPTQVQFSGLYKVTWDSDVDYQKLLADQSDKNTNLQEVDYNPLDNNAVWAVDDEFGFHGSKTKKYNEALDDQGDDSAINSDFVKDLRKTVFSMMKMAVMTTFSKKESKHFVPEGNSFRAQ